MVDLFWDEIVGNYFVILFQVYVVVEYQFGFYFVLQVVVDWFFGMFEEFDDVFYVVLEIGLYWYVEYFVVVGGNCELLVGFVFCELDVVQLYGVLQVVYWQVEIVGVVDVEVYYEFLFQ